VDAYRLPNGNLLVPRRAEAGGVVGDGMVEIGPDDPDYKTWADYYARQGKEPPPLPPGMKS
jgi:hypothetical protein